MIQLDAPPLEEYDAAQAHAENAGRYDGKADELDVVGQAVLRAATEGKPRMLYGVEIELQPSARDARVYCSVSFSPIDVRPMVPDLNEYMEELASRYENPIMIHPDNLREVESEQLEVAQIEEAAADD